MKKILATALFVMSAMVMQAQSIQLHYDLGRNLYPTEEPNRPKVTVTLEGLDIDRWGLWYYFVDIDNSRKYSEAFYTELTREIKLGSTSPISVHLEYNGGTSKSMSYQQAALLGAAWNGNTADYSKTWGVQLLYKHFFKSYSGTHPYASAQLTGIWGMNFLNNAIRFSGFIDFWRGENAANGHGKLVVLSEPQLWYNLNTIPGLKDFNLSIGTEVEISNNFVFNEANDKTFFINPTLALKWSF